MDDDPADLPRVLAAEVRRQGLTQAALAARSGLSQPVVSRLLAGRQVPTWPTVLAALAGLGRSLTWLDRRLAPRSRDQTAAG